MGTITDKNGRSYWESQTIQLGLYYHFGSNKYQAKTRREGDSDEKLVAYVFS